MRPVLLLPLVLTTLLQPLRAWAQPLESIPPGEDRIVPLRKGETAPFTGQLFDQSTAIRWGNWLEQYRVRLVLDVALQKKLGEADVRLCEEKAAAIIDAREQALKDLRARLEKAEKDKGARWYEPTVGGVALGVAVTVAAVVLGTVVVNASGG